MWEQGRQRESASGRRALSVSRCDPGADRARHAEGARVCGANSLRDTRRFLENVCVVGMEIRGLCSVQVLLAFSTAPLSPSSC